MSFFLLYIAEGKSFDESHVKRFWAECSGVSGLREHAMVGAALSACFDYDEDSSIVELKDDHQTIALSGTGKASIRMAFLMQAAIAEPLHIIDESCAFDFVISDYKTECALAQAIYKAMSEGSPR